MVPLSQVRPKIPPGENNPPTLWQQLDPLTRRQLTQQWATMLQKMRQMAQPKDDDHDPG
jgi:hypothetical protein